jgi:hypothetical protein
MTQEARLRFRIGVHVGDVMVRGSDLLGDGAGGRSAWAEDVDLINCSRNAGSTDIECNSPAPTRRRAAKSGLLSVDTAACEGRSGQWGGRDIGEA